MSVVDLDLYGKLEHSGSESGYKTKNRVSPLESNLLLSNTQTLYETKCKETGVCVRKRTHTRVFMRL